jgi:hypothetical protein
MLLLKFKVTLSGSLIHWSVVLWWGTETKLACTKQASFFNLPLDYFQNNSLQQLACCGQEANRT